MTGAPSQKPGGSTIAPPKAIAAPPEPQWVMNGQQCESCVQRAWARIYMTPDSYFELCRHHYRKHKDAILAVAWDVVDETFRIEDQKVDVSA